MTVGLGVDPVGGQSLFPSIEWVSRCRGVSEAGEDSRSVIFRQGRAAFPGYLMRFARNRATMVEIVTGERHARSMGDEQWDDLVGHLARTTALPVGSARRIVAEVVAYCNESVESFVRRRHRELQASGLANPEIFRRIASELSARPVAAPALSERQIRRIIYG